MASDITSTTQWKALENHHNSLREVTLRELFDADPSRASTLTFNAAGLHVDLSKNRMNDETLALLIDLANAAGLKRKPCSPAPTSTTPRIVPYYTPRCGYPWRKT